MAVIIASGALPSVSAKRSERAGELVPQALLLIAPDVLSLVRHHFVACMAAVSVMVDFARSEHPLKLHANGAG